MISRIAEVSLALLALYWGIILIMPGDLFAGIERYKFFNQYAPDFVWGSIMAISGLIILFHWPRQARMPAHVALCVIWSGMGILSLLSVISPPATLIAAMAFSNSIIHATKFWRLQLVAWIHP